MPEYKCISCGEIKESASPCRCPSCGYKMFETPYSRGEILRNEIRSFILRLTKIEISFGDEDLFRLVLKKEKSDPGDEFERITKKKDDSRFPDFENIRDYVCCADKTEQFFFRIKEITEKLKNHLHEPYEREYSVDQNGIKAEADTLDTILLQALSALGINSKPEKLELPALRAVYSETPDDTLLAAADGILNGTTALSEKIEKFVRQNNLFGFTSQKKRPLNYPSQKGGASDVLLRCADRLTNVLNKKYIFDIFEDGSKELQEMLQTLWLCLKTVMTEPVLKKRCLYIFEDGSKAENDEIKQALPEKINKRYEHIYRAVRSEDFLADLSEERLFELHDKMISLDVRGFMGVDQREILKIGESEKKLNELIGLSGIKESVKKIKAYALSNKGSEALNLHMCFLGNPGAGKTEVARYIAGILYENKILPTKKLIEVDRSGLVSQYFGATAEKTSAVIQSAMGGVLFIDEAYALFADTSSHGITDYGKEAIDTLVKAMEDERGKFCVILAGYRNEMQNMLSSNPGFRSRIQFTLDFPNYKRDELKLIAQSMLNKRGYFAGDAAMGRILDITDVKRKEPNFANAREIRNILDQVIMCQNLRTGDSADREIGLVDVNKYLDDAQISLPIGEEKKILSGEEELDRLIGLDSVKRMVKKIKAYAKHNRDEADFNLHMCFLGNPGTGKTQVARIISRILYDAGVLKEAKLVETDGLGLLGRFAGETGPKTEEKIKEAMGGVLFIDEAYSIAGINPAKSASANYGDEAIAALLKGMEDHRGRFSVILAGYKAETEAMLRTNPGFRSRIQFILEFPDYDRGQLREIAKAFLSKKKNDITDDALEKLLDAAEYLRRTPDFANARTVRNILDQVILNQNLRTEDTQGDDLIVLSDVEEYLKEESIDPSRPEQKNRIGFA